MRKPQIGDWVRFMRGGLLIIGTVEYISKADSAMHEWDVTTSAGTIHETEILELRGSRAPRTSEDESRLS